MLVVCPHCATLNRVPEERLGDSPVCGQCGQDILPATPVTLTDANPQVSVRYRIRSIPTLALYRGGQEVKRQSGVMPAQELARWVGV